MRRMLIETEIELLDSIKPSEIEKLGAMQDPKEAKANQVLTADGKGNAVYKDASVGKTYRYNIHNRYWPNGFIGYASFYQGNPLLQGQAEDFRLSASITCDIGNISQVFIEAFVLDDGTVHTGNLSANNGIIAIPDNNTITIYLSDALASEWNITSGSTVTVYYHVTYTELEETQVAGGN